MSVLEEVVTEMEGVLHHEDTTASQTAPKIDVV